MPRRGSLPALAGALFLGALGLPAHDTTAAQRPHADAPAIRLRAGTFVPAHGEPPIPASLRTRAVRPGARAEYIVQFAGPVQEAWKDQVRAAGGEIGEYLPDFAFRVRMRPRQAARVRRLASVRWVGFFHPAYKLSPELKRRGEHLYTVRLDEHANPATAARALAAAGVPVGRPGGRVLVVRADASRLEALARLPEVAWIEDFALREKHGEYAGAIMGAPTAWAAGYNGATQTIAIADTGLQAGASISVTRYSILDWPGRVGACMANVVNDRYLDVDSGHGTHVAALAVGTGDANGRGKGAAPAAHLVFQSVEDYVEWDPICQLLQGLTDGYYLVGIPADVRELLDQARGRGARVHSNSWGSGHTGAYSIDAQNLDRWVAANRDATVAFSAGNGGVDADGDGVVDGRSLADQASAKNVVTVGASENDRASDYPCDPGLAYTACASQAGQNTISTWADSWPGSFPAPPLSGDPTAGDPEQMAAISSRGPTDDGRIKPDVVAPGTWVLSAYSSSYQQGYDPAPNPQDGLFQYDGWGFPASAQLKYMGGTSMSNALVAGAAAVVRDYYQTAHGHDASAALVKATLINSAVDLLDEDDDGVDDNALPIPNVAEGWGRVDLAAAVDGSRAFLDEGPTLATGASLSYVYDARPGTPLKVTLVWTDPAASLSSYRRLVNDLDLEVTSPTGDVYRGNAFSVDSGGWTIPNAGRPDRANNVENVYVPSPTAGDWTVTVTGYNVPEGPQTFALVVAGQVAEPIHTLTVESPGSLGTITSDDGFILCGLAGTACSHGYASPSVVTLKATGSAYSGLFTWTGDCSGNSPCRLVMTRSHTVGAIFRGPIPPPPGLGITIYDATIPEGRTGIATMPFVVDLRPARAQAVTVDFATADGTATVSDHDYEPMAGTLTFAPGQTQKSIVVLVYCDSAVERRETLTVRLSNPTNADIVRGQALGTIVNDDVATRGGTTGGHPVRPRPQVPTVTGRW